MKKIFFPLIVILAIAACNAGPANTKETTGTTASVEKTVAADTVQKNTMADAATILAKKQVPVLCYHHIRDFKPGESERMKSYSVTPAAFAAQMKMLADSGYQTVLPEQVYNYLLYDAKLPEKPVMLTFDDTDEEQFSIGAAEMKKHGFKGVYFIMTISMGRPRYMSKDQLKQLADDGHLIASHTWDHHMVTKYQGEDWNIQLVKPKAQLETIAGKPVEYFAYPFGLWNKAAIPEIKKAGYKMAFILSTKRDSTDPLYTVRRMIVPGTWSTNGMMNAMKSTFK